MCLRREQKLTELPSFPTIRTADQFFDKNIFNVAGGIDLAFMSTSTEKDVALDYIRGCRGRHGVVFEIDMGMIDKGADLSAISQYSGEREILFGPLTGLEVLNMRMEAGVLVIGTRLNCNLKNETLEEMQGRMKRVHMQLVDIVEGDCVELGFDSPSMHDLHVHALEAQDTEAVKFNDAAKFLDLNTKALQCKVLAAKTVIQRNAETKATAQALLILLNSQDEFAFTTAVRVFMVLVSNEFFVAVFDFASF